jgi:hypothetical protein
MRPPKAHGSPETQQLPGGALRTDDARVDALYGLDPVFEPGTDARQRPLDASIEIACPHCWQAYESSVDLTLGAQSWIEDCQHCCHPIAVEVEVVDDGRGARVSAGRLDA